MTKQEFIEGIGRSLKGKIDDIEYMKQLEYYSSYIDDEVRKGKTEEEVLEALGDPRLIAKTIVQTYVMSDDPTRSYYKAEANGFREETYEDNSDSRSNTETKFEEYTDKAKRILYIAFGVLVLLLVLSLVFKVVAFLAPIAFVILAVIIIVNLLKNRTM